MMGKMTRMLMQRKVDMLPEKKSQLHACVSIIAEYVFVHNQTN